MEIEHQNKLTRPTWPRDRCNDSRSTTATVASVHVGRGVVDSYHRPSPSPLSRQEAPLEPKGSEQFPTRYLVVRV